MGQAATPHVPDVDAPGVQVFRDVDGKVAALAYRAGDDHCLHVPKIGTFTLAANAEDISVTPLESVAPELVEDTFHRAAVPFALQLAGRDALHASAVVIDGVVALCGRSGSGKSTLAYALNRRGYPQWSDDVVAFEHRGAGVECRSLPFRVRLRPASAEWFDDPAYLKGSALSAPWRGGSEGTLPFRALFVLEPSDASSGYEGDETVTIDRLAPADAFTAVLPHAYFLTLDDGAMKRALLDRYLELAERVPVFTLRYTQNLPLIDRIAERLTSTVARL
ncbi:MAG TPA: hypothetical protein VMZ00_06765 [Sporichthya sp.]|nr:hypothetical protein [Sporichthya sp.]